MSSRIVACLSVVALAVGASLVPVQAQAAPVEVRPSAAVQDVPASAFVPPADADEHAVPAANAPVDAWEPENTSRSVAPAKKGSVTNTVPVGTTVGAPGLGSLPYFAFDKTSLSLDTVAQVNLGNGNLVLTSNDGVLNGVGPALRNDRFYNGLSSTSGSYGGGWSSSLSQVDVGIQVSGSTPTFHGSNGFSATFAVSGSTYTPPAGFNASLVKNTGSTTAYWTITYSSSGETLQFSTTGYLTADLDRNGVGYHYAYNSSGQVSTVTSDTGRQFTVTWASTSSNYITGIQDSSGRSIQYTRNSSGQLQRVDKSGGNYEIYYYDSVGRISQALFTGTGNGDMQVDFTYDTSSRVTKISQSLASSTPTILQSTSYSYGSGTTTLTDGNGHATTYAVDSSGRVTSATDALGHVRAQTYNPNSNVATTTDALGSGSTPGNLTTYSYDSLNNATGISYPTGAAASATYSLPGSGCTGSGGTTHQPKCSSDDAGNTQAYTYDTAGNLLNQKDTTGGAATTTNSYVYDNASRSICGGFAGQVCSSTDGNGHTTTYNYDNNGNLITVTPPAPMGATTYTLDSLGRILYVTNGKGDTTGYVYDARDDVIQTNFAGLGSLSVAFYQNGVHKSDQDSTGLKLLTYDGAGRELQQTGPTSGLTQTYTYDHVGNILSYTDATGTTTYVYDNANELTQLIEPSGTCTTGTTAPAANSGCVKYLYNNNGAETKRSFPGGATVTTTRDASGRATRVTAKNSAGTTVNDIGYSYTVAGGTGPSADRTDIQSRTSYLEQGITAGAITSYTYDSLDRLKTATEKSGTTTTASWTYSYDTAGNRTQQATSGSTGSAVGTTSYSYNNADELTSTSADTTTWTYDGAGNQTRNGLSGLSQSVDARGAVTSLGTASYTIFGQGNTEQLTRTAGSATTNYIQSSLGLASETSGSSLTAFDRTPSGDVDGLRIGTTRDYFVKDALDSVVGIFDSTGAYLGGYSYSPYGESLAVGTSAAVVANPVRYISGYRDVLTGLYRLGARYYDSSLGRFTQVDPSGQERNPFLYAKGNPVDNSDPSGNGAISAFIRLAVLFYDTGNLLGAFNSLSVSNQEAAAIAIGSFVGFGCDIAVTALAVPTGGAAAALSLLCTALGATSEKLIESLED